MPKTKTKEVVNLKEKLERHKSFRNDLHGIAYVGFNDDGNIGTLISGQFDIRERTLVLHEMLKAFLEVENLPQWILNAPQEVIQGYLGLLHGIINKVNENISLDALLDLVVSQGKKKDEKQDEEIYH